MDFQKKLVDYQAEYTRKKNELEQNIQGIRQLTHERAEHLLQNDAQGAELAAEKQNLDVQLTERGYELVQSDPVGVELFKKGHELQEQLNAMSARGLVSILFAIHDSLINITDCEMSVGDLRHGIASRGRHSASSGNTGFPSLQPAVRSG